VNLRNEGPRYDTGYYQFKEAAHKEKLDLFFWDLNFDVIQKRTIQQNLTNDILAMLKIQDINTSCYNSRWLASISKNMANLSGIGFGMAASQKNKRWPTAKWLKLANAILLNSDQKIIIFSGNSAEETKQAQDIFQMIGEKRCKLISRQSLKDVAAQIGGLECLVSNDTGLLHIASAANVPAIGLYMNTDPNIWSPRDKTNFIACQNSFMKKCPNSKPYCGNCFHYYDICPAIKQYGDDIEPLDVFEHIVAMLTQNLIFSCSVNFLDSRLVFN
jgi:ADP-heptose:LPS heptosyltransferase